jgi:phosphoribosylglycinamide formyltransferase-1
MPEQFISAAIQPVAGTFDAARMSTGEPGLPRQFRWGSQTIQIARVLKTWRETGPCRHGSGERYVRKHWFEVLTDSGETMQIYFQRQPRSRTNSRRWWLFTVEAAENKTAAPRETRS